MIDLFPQDKLELHQNLLKHKGIESTISLSPHSRTQYTTAIFVLHENTSQLYNIDSVIVSPVDQALSEARASLEQIQEEVQAWQAQHSSLNKKLKTEKAVNSTLKVRIVFPHSVNLFFFLQITTEAAGGASVRV